MWESSNSYSYACHLQALDDLHIVPGCAWADSAWWVVLIGVANKRQYVRRSWTLPNDSKHNETSFSTISTDMLYLQVAQTPRSPDLVIFVLTTTDDNRWRKTITDDDRPNWLLYPLRMRAGLYTTTNQHAYTLALKSWGAWAWWSLQVALRISHYCLGHPRQKISPHISRAYYIPCTL